MGWRVNNISFCRYIFDQLMKRILIAGANPYNANKGVAALAYSTIHMVNKIMSESNCEYEICVYNHEFRKTFDTIELPQEKIKFQNVYPSNIFGIKNFLGTITSKWRLCNLREFLKADIILNVTAGDSFSDIYGEDNFNSQNVINRLARLFHKKVLFLPQTYGPFVEGSPTQKSAFRSLRKSIKIISRDKESTLYLKQHGFEDVTDAVDMAFYLPYNSKCPKEIAGTHVGINISKTLWEKSKEHKFELAVDYRDCVYKIIQSMLDKGYIVHFIPHVVDSRDMDGDEYFLAYQLWKEFGNPNLKLSPFFHSPVEAKSYISSMDLFIGSRMHACIGAFSSNTPVLLLGYSRKFSGLFSETLGYKYNVDLTADVSIDDINAVISKMLSDKENIRSQIEMVNKTIVADAITKIEQILKEILS